MPRFKVLRRFLFIVVIVNLDSSFTHGYNVTVVKDTRPVILHWLEDAYGIDEPIFFLSWTGEDLFRAVELVFCGAAIIGSLLVQPTALKFGRKGGMLVASFLGVAGALFCGYSKYFNSFGIFLTGRFFLGLKTGINNALAPMYLWEISPPNIRDNIASLYGGGIAVGSLVSHLLTMAIGNKIFWPLTYSFNLVPSIVLLSFLPRCPESPRYLFVMKKNILDVRNAVKWLTGDVYDSKEAAQISVEYYQYKRFSKFGFFDIAQNIILREALLISVVLLVGQQLCGVSLIFFYVRHNIKGELFEDGYGFLYIRIGVSSVMLFFSVATSLLISERFSMKRLCMFSFFCLSLLCATTVFVATKVRASTYRADIFIVLIILFTVFYKIGVGTVSWGIASHYFNTALSPVVYSVGCSAKWLTRFVIILFLEPLLPYLKTHILSTYAFTNAILCYFVYTKMPSGRDKSLKELYQKLYKINKWKF